MDYTRLSDAAGRRLVKNWLKCNMPPLDNAGLLRFPRPGYGWFYNRFFEAGMSHLWRSNDRCTKKWFAERLEQLLCMSMIKFFPAIVFHDLPICWRRRRCGGTNFLLLKTREELITAFHQLFYYMEPVRKDGRVLSDNYNILSFETQTAIVFSHETDFFVFSTSYDALNNWKSAADSIRLKLRLFSEPSKCSKGMVQSRVDTPVTRNLGGGACRK
jgi:hypothetical protein